MVEYEMTQRIEALRLFRGNGEDVMAKLNLLKETLPESTKECIDADIEVITLLIRLDYSEI